MDGSASLDDLLTDADSTKVDWVWKVYLLMDDYRMTVGSMTENGLRRDEPRRLRGLHLRHGLAVLEPR
jgi:hypothetical protein